MFGDVLFAQRHGFGSGCEGEEPDGCDVPDVCAVCVCACTGPRQLSGTRLEIRLPPSTERVWVRSADGTEDGRRRGGRATGSAHGTKNTDDGPPRGPALTCQPEARPHCAPDPAGRPPRPQRAEPVPARPRWLWPAGMDPVTSALERDWA